jgi:hypothetical protein
MVVLEGPGIQGGEYIMMEEHMIVMMKEEILAVVYGGDRN